VKNNSSGKPLHQFYPSLTSAVEAAVSGPDWCNSLYANREGFMGGVTHDGARQLALFGWTDGARQASERAARVVDRVMRATTDVALDAFEWDVTGACFDVGTYLTGEPECWLRPSEATTKRGIHICVNSAASGGVPAQTLMARGITIASLALALQTRGYPLTIDVVECSNHFRDGYQSLVVRIVEANGAPLDVDRLVYSLAHPSMLRGIIANAYGKRQDQWGVGQPDSNGRPDNAPEYDLYVGGVHLYDTARWTDEQQAEAWVVAQYLEQTKG
jgi:hypothetical protein